MADYELRFRKRPGPIARMLGTIGESALLQSLGDQELDAAEPKVVWHTERSAALRDLAFALVGAGADDLDAVGELARSAGRHPKELRRAAATIRAEGLAEEDEASCRADRLLVAAAAGRPVEPVTADEAAWFAEVRALEGLPVAAGFAVLAAQDPGLGVLADQVRHGVDTPAPDSGGDGITDEAVDDRVDAGLAEVIGRSPSPLVRTRAAGRIARHHLRSIAGAPVAGTTAPEADGGPQGGAGIPGPR